MSTPAVWWSVVLEALEAESFGLPVEDEAGLEEAVVCLVVDSMVVDGMTTAGVEAKVQSGIYGIHLSFSPDEGSVGVSLIWPDGSMSTATGDVSSLI